MFPSNDSLDPLGHLPGKTNKKSRPIWSDFSIGGFHQLQLALQVLDDDLHTFSADLENVTRKSRLVIWVQNQLGDDFHYVEQNCFASNKFSNI